jgi:hypothetical protein
MLWISVEFLCRRRIGEGGGRTRLEMDKRLGVCGGGRVHRLRVDGLFGLRW